MSYIVGESIKFTAVFRDDTGALWDPSVITCTCAKPDGSKVNPTSVYDSVGNYHASQELDAAGPWIIQFKGSGPSGLIGIGEKSFFVEPSKL